MEKHSNIRNYPIVTDGKFLYMIDKEAKKSFNDAVICKAAAGNIYAYKAQTFYKDLNVDPDYWKILATNNPELGLPILEVPTGKDDFKELLFSAWRHGSIGSGSTEEDDKIAFDEWWENGNWWDTKLYTEEDMLKIVAYIAGRVFIATSSKKYDENNSYD